MGTDRIIDMYFSKLAKAEVLLCSLDICRRRFGMRAVKSPIFFTASGEPSSCYLYRYQHASDEWLTIRFADLESLIQELTVASPFENWIASLSLDDSKSRFFCDVHLVGVMPDVVSSFRLKMRRDTLMFGDRDKVPPDVFRSASSSEKEKAEFARNWVEHEQELVELERQEYHFMRTLFAMLPDAVGLDLFITDPDLEDCISYCFTRGENLPEHLSKEKRLPEFEKWCDEHEPEYWQKLTPPVES